MCMDELILAGELHWEFSGILFGLFYVYLVWYFFCIHRLRIFQLSLFLL